MNSTEKFNATAQASIDQVDLEQAQQSVNGILHGQVTEMKTRKPRSDKGVPKKPTSDPDEIVLRVSLQDARELALGDVDHIIAAKVQDQIIAQLQKRIDSLSRVK